MVFAAPQTLRGLLWAVAAAEAQDSMTEEVKATLAEFALQGVHTCSPRALEVMVWATKRSLLDMQDVYHACLAAVRAPPVPRTSKVCPFCSAQAQSGPPSAASWTCRTSTTPAWRRCVPPRGI